MEDLIQDLSTVASDHEGQLLFDGDDGSAISVPSSARTSERVGWCHLATPPLNSSLFRGS